jgi:hypothetical protein
MQRFHKTLIGSIATLLAITACVPVFTDGAFQTLKLTFELSEAIAAGDDKLLQVSAFPSGIKVRKNLVRVSGQLLAPDGEDLPGTVKVLAVLENDATGRVAQRISMTLKIQENGLFSANKKIKKNIGSSDIMSVTIEPSGSQLAAGTTITLCVDLVKKKSELKDLPACADQGTGGGADGVGGATLTSLQNDFLTPTCARSGCHSGADAPGGLSLVAGQSFGNLVNVPSSQVAGLNRVTPNDPQESYLVKKLRGDSDIIGQRMPRGGPFLSGEELDRFITWINDGAADN